MIVFFLDGAINLVAGMWQETPCDYDSIMHNAMRRLAVDFILRTVILGTGCITDVILP